MSIVALDEMWRRTAGRVTSELHSLPILALSVHSACNCRCVMCDIWKANADKREISSDDLDRHIDSIRRLHVQRVMLTGGEPLLHSNLWALCDRLRAEGIAITLVTTGLLIERHAADIARAADHVVISIDGPADIHDQIRGVRGGFGRIARGVHALRRRITPPRLIARSVVQKANYAYLVDTIDATCDVGFDQVSFLAADLTSTAFNRPVPWQPARQSEIALSADDLARLCDAVDEVEHRRGTLLATGFVAGDIASLRRIYDYYCAVAGLREFPLPRCNAPWVSAVLEPNGQVRPCFFHAAYESGGHDLAAVVNAPSARAFRRELDVRRNDTCKRCVCSLSVPAWGRV